MITLAVTLDWLRAVEAAMVEHEELLIALDSAIGDADHGTNLRRGMAAVVAHLETEPPATIGAALQAAGMTLVSTVGGASGPLYGTLLLRSGGAAGDSTALDGPSWARALRAGIEGVRDRGRAELGDKTMVDVLLPAIDAMDAALATGAPLALAASAAALAAEAARDATAPLVARRGRASYLGERSAGHVDPGAASSALLLAVLAAVLADAAEGAA